MKKMKRVAGFWIVAAILMLTSQIVSAASGGYVPTKAVVYEYKDGKWVKQYTIKSTFSKDGKLKKRVSTSPGSLGDDIYTWKGSYITKASVFTPGKGTVDTFTFSNGLLKKHVMDTAAGITTYKYKWTNNKAKVTKTGAGFASTQTVKVNSKKQIITKTVKNKDSDGKFVSSYKYYKDGKIKQIVMEVKGPDYSQKTVRTYNKNGYPVSQKSDDMTVSWKYTMDKKKNCPKQAIITSRYGGNTSKTKVVFKSFKKVSKIRNCDASGREILLVPNIFISEDAASIL